MCADPRTYTVPGFPGLVARQKKIDPACGALSALRPREAPPISPGGAVPAQADDRRRDRPRIAEASRLLGAFIGASLAASPKRARSLSRLSREANPCFTRPD